MCTLWSYNRKLYLWLDYKIYPHIGVCRPGLFRIMRTHITRNRCKDPPPHIAYASRTDVHIAYSVGTKYAFHNCASNASYSQVLPGYPHSSAGAYAPSYYGYFYYLSTMLLQVQLNMFYGLNNHFLQPRTKGTDRNKGFATVVSEDNPRVRRCLNIVYYSICRHSLHLD